MAKRQLIAEDLFQFALVGRTSVHPNGRHAICEVSHLDKETNRTVTHLWRIDTNGGEQTPLTWGDSREGRPQYSPDGRFMAFVEWRDDAKGQLYVMRTDGGEAIQVTQFRHGIQSFLWHPSGASLLVQAAVEPNDDGAENPRSRFTKDVRFIDRTWYRLDGVGFFGNARVHLFAVDVSTLVKHHPPAREAIRRWDFPVRQITAGAFDVGDYTCSPDGKRVALVSNLNADADETQHRFVYETSFPSSFDHVADTGVHPDWPQVPLRLPIDLLYVERIAYSPSGNDLALIGDNREEGQYTLSNLYVCNLDTKALVNVSAAWDITFGNAMLSDLRAGVSIPFLWSEHGRHLYTVASQQGSVQMVRIQLDKPGIEWLTHGRHTVLTFDMSQDRGTAVLLIETAVSPANLFVQNISLAGEALTVPRVLTDLNHSLLESVLTVQPERIFLEDGDGLLEGWIMLPKKPCPKGGYSTVVEVHGGPVAAYGESFFLEFQLLAAAGIAVVFCNPRGSLGYGQSHCKAIRGRWGTDDFLDIERFVDAVSARYPLNTERMAIAGGSYGGFMAAYAIGQTNRYRAAVVMRACVNEYSMFGTCDLGFTDIEDLSVAPWEDPTRYERLSPIAFADRIKASVLILHAENDLRCPIEQAEQLYAALRYHNVPVKMIRFPDESHGMSRNGQPWHRVLRLEQIVQFLRQHLLEPVIE